MNNFCHKTILKKICDGKSLKVHESEYLFSKMAKNEINPLLSSAFITSMRCKPEDPEEIEGAIRGLIQLATPLKVLPSTMPLVDCAGTGGCHFNGVNISTAVSILAATYPLKVAKHGSFAQSSLSGSADVLKALGVNIQLSPEESIQQLNRSNFTFLLAPKYHSYAKAFVELRKSLGIQTIFNCLGPLLNPSRPEIQLVGTYRFELCLPMIKTLKQLGTKTAYVFHGHGIDELTLEGLNRGYLLKDGKISYFEINPSELSLDSHPLSNLKGSDPKTNAQALLDLLNGQGSKAYQDTVALNLGVLLWLSGCFASIDDGIKSALNRIKSKKGLEKLNELCT